MSLILCSSPPPLEPGCLRTFRIWCVYNLSVFKIRKSRKTAVVFFGRIFSKLQLILLFNLAERIFRCCYVLLYLYVPGNFRSFLFKMWTQYLWLILFFQRRPFPGISDQSSCQSLECVFPELVSCKVPVDQILPSILAMSWSRGMGHLVRAQNIHTIGNLSALKEDQVTQRAHCQLCRNLSQWLLRLSFS